MRLGHIYHALGDHQRGLDLLKKAVEAFPGEPLRDRVGGPVGPTRILPVLSRTFLLWALACRQ